MGNTVKRSLAAAVGALTLAAGMVAGASPASAETIYIAAGSRWEQPYTFQPYGKTRLAWQSDGNLVVYCNRDGRPLWASGTYGNPGSLLRFQPDGNLVIYRADGTAIWSSGTFWQDAQGLEIQMDGNVVIYKGYTPVWSTGTYGAC